MIMMLPCAAEMRRTVYGVPIPLFRVPRYFRGSANQLGNPVCPCQHFSVVIFLSFLECTDTDKGLQAIRRYPSS